MFSSRTRLIGLTTFLIACGCIFLSLKIVTESKGVTHTVTVFKKGTKDFVLATRVLKDSLAMLESDDPASLTAAKKSLKECRLRYKRIEFFLDYYFASESLIYNQPAKVEVEEPFIEYQEPSGFQVIEAILYGPDPAKHMEELTAQADLMYSSAFDLDAMLYGFRGTDQGMMESLRLALVKVISLGITGYDAPELKSGIEESSVSLQVIDTVLQSYYNGSQTAERLRSCLRQTITFLKGNPDFDHFNRMVFLTGYALPLQQHLSELIAEEQLTVNTRSALNYSAANLFSKDALLPEQFSAKLSDHAQAAAALGARLFGEKALSGNLQRSCKTCHRPGEYFADGLKTSLAMDGKHFVQRNAPSLFYAGFQYAQFWDGRAKTLEEQIQQVVSNPLEMDGDHKVIVANLRKIPSYVEDFRKAYPGIKGELITTENLSSAIAAYIGTLNPRNSDFDRYIAGDPQAMTPAQIRGFNLFMGKGQCGSCHFAPLFNGLIPPYYKRTEFEILGTPANDDLDHPQADTDKGRADFFPIVYYEATFKTPTVRNSDKTAPYMHNGVFKDLQQVVEFYNRGGGAGLHLEVPQQTLSAKPLHLTDGEIKEIVLFMQSLTDH